MRTSFENGVRAVQVFHPVPNALYSLEMAANMAHIPRRTILLYCKHHLVSPVENSPLAGFYFDNEAIRQLQRIEELRERFGCNMAGLKFMLKLMNEVERLQFEQRFFAA
jgi:DNA-binding transcriptional MerR regulator